MKKISSKEKLVGFFVLVSMTALLWTSWLDPLESMFLKQRFSLRGERSIPSDILIIGIDEASLDHPRSGPWPWARSTYAQFIYELGQINPSPRVLSFEMLFQSKNLRDEPGDDALVYRTEEFENPIVIGYFLEEGYRSRFERVDESDEQLKPYEIIHIKSLPKKLNDFTRVALPYLELSDQAALGFLNYNSSKGADPGAVQLIGKYRDKIYPSIILISFLKYIRADIKQVILFKDKIIVRKSKTITYEIPITAEGHMWINFYGQLKNFTENYRSFVDISQSSTLMSPVEMKSMQKKIADKLFLVGRTAPSIKDDIKTPFSNHEPAVSVRAQAIGNILEHKVLVRSSIRFDTILIFVFVIGAILLMQYFSVQKSGIIIAILILIYFLVTQIFFSLALWLPFILPTLTLTLVYLAIVGIRYFAALEELKKTQLQLIHSAKMATMGQVSANMAHEFRNIMHAVKLHVEACAKPGMKPERIQKYMGVIFKTMTNAELILNGILTFSRKSQSDRKIGELEKTIQDTLLLLKREFEYQNIQVSLHLEKVSLFAFDAGQISQVIMNLMNNARDALKNQKEKMVMISLREDENNIYLDVADNGPGIPKEVMKNLFQAFVTTKEEGHGTGLGLSMCQKIVQNHGGDITPKSLEGQGTVWHIVFPKKEVV
jgi:signal transduction histidine kinase